jgi:hypothetical protein
MDGEIVRFFAAEAGLFVVGLVLGALIFGTIALPLLYALPRALWWALRGRLRWRVVPGFFLSAILWCALFVLAAYAFAFYAPGAWDRLYASPPFYLGLWLGIGLRAFRGLGSKSGRRKLRDAFLESVKSHFKRRQRTQEEEMGEDIYKPVWHMSRRGTRYGPFTYDELCRRARRGDVRDTDLLWRPGVTEWAEASSILGPIKKSKFRR